MNTKIILITLCVLFSGFKLCAQDVKEADVPSEVKTKFSTMYPGVTGAKWEIENGKYEAEFKQSGTETSVIFESNGTYVQTETEIPVSSLPSKVSDYARTLKSDKINEAAQITSAGGTITYEAEIGKDDYIFDESGNFLKKDSDSGDTEDDDKK